MLKQSIFCKYGNINMFFFRILVFEKNALSENRVSGTVLMIQLMRNSPTCAYIGQNPSMWKPR